MIELSLTERYSCGRAAIRAALVELVAEGLVEHAANRGATVRRIGVAEAIQITEARAALEVLIATNAARQATDSERTELLSIVSQMAKSVENDDNTVYSELNRVFHRRIREISGHQIASELVANLRNRAAHHQYRLAMMPGRSKVSLEQHTTIAKAIAEGDEPGAAKAMEHHLMSVVGVLQQWGDAGPD